MVVGDLRKEVDCFQGYDNSRDIYNKEESLINQGELYQSYLNYLLPKVRPV